MADASSFMGMGMDPNMIWNIAAQLGSQLQPGQHGAFQGRFSPPQITGAGMFSFSRAGQAFGETGQMLGSVLDIGGMSGMFGEDFRGFTQTLQANRNVDPMLLARERSMMQAQAQLSMGISGQNVAKAFGLDPTKGAGAFVSANVGMLSMMSPEFRSSLDFITPGAMTTGGRDLAGAVQMQDIMQRINPNTTEAMKAAFMERTMEGSQRRNDRTGGLNLDDFAQVVRYSQDVGARDSESARGTVEFGKRVSTLKASGKTDAQAEAQAEQESLVRSGEHQAGVVRAMNRTFGLTTGESLQVMRENGMVAGDKGSSDKLSEAINKIEALGKAAGLTTQDLANAGRVIQQQYGGSFVAAAQLAAETRATERMGTQPGNLKAAERNTQAIIAQRSAETQGRAANALLAGLGADPNSELFKLSDRIAKGGTASEQELLDLNKMVAADPERNLLQNRLATDSQFRDSYIERTNAKGYDQVALNTAINKVTSGARRYSLGQTKLGAGFLGGIGSLSQDELKLMRGISQGNFLDANDKGVAALRSKLGNLGQSTETQWALIQSEVQDRLLPTAAVNEFAQVRRAGDVMADIYMGRQQSIVGTMGKDFSFDKLLTAAGVKGNKQVNDLMGAYASGGPIDQWAVSALAGYSAINSKDEASQKQYLEHWTKYQGIRAEYDKGMSVKDFDQKKLSELKEQMSAEEGYFSSRGVGVGGNAKIDPKTGNFILMQGADKGDKAVTANVEVNIWMPDGTKAKPDRVETTATSSSKADKAAAGAAKDATTQRNK